MAMKFWEDLRRRRVYRLAALYVVAAWFLIQVADVFFPAWGIPATGLRYLIIAAALCFPVALVFAWFFDVTAGGIVRTREAGAGESVDIKLAMSDYVMLVALAGIAIAILAGSFDRIRQSNHDTVSEAPKIEKPENSVAVLPFENLDGNPDAVFFSDGVSEEILQRLASVKRLKVLGRASSFAFRDSNIGLNRISDILGVRYLLSGTVRRSADGIRLTASLVDESGFQVWSESYDGNLASVFDLQTEIAKSVAGQISDELAVVGKRSAASSTTNVDAYTHYLIGREFFNKRTPGWKEDAAQEYRRAIAADPTYAPPYAGLGVALALTGGIQNRESLRAEAGRAIKLAIELDENLGEAYAARALLGMRSLDPDLVAAVADLRISLQLDPNSAITYSWLANAFQSLGLDEEAKAAQNLGYELDPLNPTITENMAIRRLAEGDFQTSERMLLRLTNLPRPPGGILWSLHTMYLNYGRFSDAVHWAKKVAAAYSDTNVSLAFGTLAFDYERLGLSDDADYWLEQLRKYHADPIQIFLRKSYLLKLRGDLKALAREQQVFDEKFDLDLSKIPRLIRVRLGVTRILGGQLTEGIANLEAALGLDDPTVNTITTSPESAQIMHYLAWAHRQLGNRDAANYVIERIRQSTLAIRSTGEFQNKPIILELVVLDEIAQGNLEQAAVSFEIAIDAGWREYYWAVNDPLWQEFISTPQFAPLMARVKKDVDRQRDIVLAADAAEDFKEKIERLMAERN